MKNFWFFNTTSASRMENVLFPLGRPWTIARMSSWPSTSSEARERYRSARSGSVSAADDGVRRSHGPLMPCGPSMFRGASTESDPKKRTFRARVVYLLKCSRFVGSFCLLSQMSLTPPQNERMVGTISHTHTVSSLIDRRKISRCLLLYKTADEC